MTRHTKVLLAGTALAVIGLGGAAAVARNGHQGWGGHGKGHSLFMPGMGRMGMVCRDGRSAEMADHMLVRLEHRAKLTDAQKPVFEELKTAVRSAATKMQAGCPAKPADAKSAEGSPPAEGEKRKRPSPIERLASAETMTAATLDAIKTVRPAAEKFYASLSDDQKTAIEDRPGRGKWGWGRGKGDGDRGEGRERGPDRGDRDDDRGDGPKD